jgi:hypothetical protein
MNNGGAQETRQTAHDTVDVSPDVAPFQLGGLEQTAAKAAASPRACAIETGAPRRKLVLVALAAATIAAVLLLLLLDSSAGTPSAPSSSSSSSSSSPKHTKITAVGALQRQVVATLTGHGASNWTLSERHTRQSRLETIQYLESQLVALGIQPMRHSYSATGINVYALLPASGENLTETSAVVVLGAHFDTVADSPGANDNASGVALVLGVAMELLRAGGGSKGADGAAQRAKGVMVVFFDEEEVGLKGSRAFAQKLIDDNIKVDSVHTVDQVGWDSNNDRSFEIELPYLGAYELYERAATKVAAAAAAAAAAVGPPPLGATIVHLSNVATTDHASFRNVGYKAVGVTEMYAHGDTTPHYHQTTDVYDTVDFGYLESVTLTVAEAFQEIVTAAS